MRALLVAAVLAASPAIAEDSDKPIEVMPICKDGAVIGVRIIVAQPVMLAPQIVDLVPPASLCKAGDA